MANEWDPRKWVLEHPRAALFVTKFALSVRNRIPVHCGGVRVQTMWFHGEGLFVCLTTLKILEPKHPQVSRRGLFVLVVLKGVRE